MTSRTLWALTMLAPGFCWMAGCAIPNNQRCSEGRIYRADYGGCTDPPEGGVGGSGGGSSASGSSGGAGGGSSAPDGGGTAPIEAGADASSATDAGDSGVGLGTLCMASNDCASAADGAVVCLLDPTHPSNPGVCTIPNCSKGQCGPSFTCCNCAQTPAAQVLTTPMCVASSEAATLEGVGCLCQ
jgi:hypothetical protein